MERIKRNLVANFLGKAWLAAIGLSFIPLYIRFIGIEAYGLVGFYATLAAGLTLLDMGLSTTLNRQMARYSARPEDTQEMNDLLKTLESTYWIGVMLVAATVVLVAPLIARHWINAQDLSISTVTRVVTLMGMAVAFQMLFGFYSGGLLGLQRQVLYNAVNVGVITLRSGGAALVLWLLSPTVLAFFIWQVISGFLGVVVVAFILKRLMPRGRGTFRAKLLGMVWPFAAGMSVSSILGLLLVQIDMVILSKLLSLEAFGYYALAGTVAAGLQYLGNPVFTAYFPSFAQKVAAGDSLGLNTQYHKAAQVLSIAVLPLQGLLVFFAPQVVLAWTANPTLVAHTHLLITLLSLGTSLNLLASIPYGMQLAHGWTSLAVWSNLVAVCVMTPSMLLAVRAYGAVGAACMSVVLNAGYVLVYVPLMHRRILRGEERRWYFQDVIPSVVAVVIVGAVARLVVNGTTPRLFLVMQLMAIYIFMLMGAVLVAPKVRTALLQYLRRKSPSCEIQPVRDFP